MALQKAPPQRRMRIPIGSSQARTMLPRPQQDTQHVSSRRTHPASTSKMQALTSKFQENRLSSLSMRWSTALWTTFAVASTVVTTRLLASYGVASMMGRFGGISLEAYKQAMSQNPLWTKIGTGVTLAVLGDTVGQLREPAPYNAKRTFSFAVFDCCYRAFQHSAFPFIVRVCQGRLLGSILSILPFVSVGGNVGLFLASLERTLMYQLGVIPLFYYPVFFTFTGLIQGLSIRETYERAKANFLPCWRTNLMFWMPIQIVMFGFIAENWQIPFVCVMGLIWSTILSVIAGKAN